MFTSRYIDPTTDFGFKRLFGQEDSKDILISFLESVLDLPAPIAELTYVPNEQLPESPEDRIGIYDVYCVDTAGRRFIVEMQRSKAGFSMERALYYVTFPITQMVQKGREGPPFALLPIYCISVLSFAMDDEPTYIREVHLIDTAHNRVFYDKLTFVFIELSKFNQALDQLTSIQDKWLYLLTTMPGLDDIPKGFDDIPFTQAFSIAEQVMLSPDDRLLYEGSLKRKRDELSAAYTAREEGREEGRIEGYTEGHAEGHAEGHVEGRLEERRAIAHTMLAEGIDHTLITRLTGLSQADLATLL